MLRCGVCVLTRRELEELVEKTARLARIRVGEEEKRVLAEDFSRILGFFSEIRELEIGDEPLYHAGGSEGHLRGDEPGKTLDRRLVEELFHEVEGGYLKTVWRYRA